MRLKLLFLFLLLTSCVNIKDIQADKNGNMNCYYNDILVFTGKVNVKGIALDKLDLNGTWVLCNENDNKTKCIISFTKTSTSL